MSKTKTPKIIKDLKKIIYDNLANEIKSDYCLLDIPDHGNIGDHLIWKGERDFLDSLGLNQKYVTSIDFFNKNMIENDDLILLHGGGNLGDLYPKHQKFREYIVNNFKNNKIIIFPQTIYFQNKENLNRAINIFSKHKNLIICARDKISYNFIKMNFKMNKILLVPDMAFYCNFKKPIFKVKSNKTLFLHRMDKETGNKVKLKNIYDVEIRDWPTINPTLKNKIIEKIQSRIIKLKFNFFKLEPNYEKYTILYINQGINLIKDYNLVITNRLHGHILSILLDIPSKLIDNSYGKNKNFYNTWLKDFNNLELLS